MELYAAFTLGLFGSLHCVGMCAPLMMTAQQGRWVNTLSYQAGRLLTYVLLGGILGGLGLGLKLWNAQSSIAFFTGGALLLFALLRLDPGNWLQRNAAYAAFQVRVRAFMAKMLSYRGVPAQFALGCCNGLLPCGLVYLAIVGAANAGSPVAGATFMLAFGMGTLPLLITTLLAGKRILRIGADRIAALTPILLAVSGCLLIYRGWITHVPYEFLNYQDLANPPMCH